MHSPYEVSRYDFCSGSRSKSKIEVLEPAGKCEAFIEHHAFDRFQTECHIATIRGVWPDAIVARGWYVGRGIRFVDQHLSLRPRKSPALDGIQQHPPGHGSYVHLSREQQSDALNPK